MADTITDADERVRAHVRKVMTALKALKDRQRPHGWSHPNESLASAVEVHREDDLPNGIGSVKRPA